VLTEQPGLLMVTQVPADAVNPLGVTRDAWRDVADGNGARLVEVELVCTDRAAHGRPHRLDNRIVKPGGQYCRR